MGERGSGRPPNLAPTVDKVMGTVWDSWCCPGLLAGIRYRQCAHFIPSGEVKTLYMSVR